MPNIEKILTMTAIGSNAGPDYSVYYSSNCSDYTLISSSVALPNIGSTIQVSIPDTTTCIKMVNLSGGCFNNDFIYYIGAPTTTTTSTSTSTTTAAPTGSTTTTSTSTTSTTTISPTSTTTTAAPVITYWSASYCNNGNQLGAIRATGSVNTGTVITLNVNDPTLCATLGTQIMTTPFFYFSPQRVYADCNTCQGITTTTTSTSTTTQPPYVYYVATRCDDSFLQQYFRTTGTYTAGESVRYNGYCWEIQALQGASGVDPESSYINCTACNGAFPTTSTTTTTTAAPTTTTTTISPFTACMSDFSDGSACSCDGLSYGTWTFYGSGNDICSSTTITSTGILSEIENNGFFWIASGSQVRYYQKNGTGSSATAQAACFSCPTTTTTTTTTTAAPTTTTTTTIAPTTTTTTLPPLVVTNGAVTCSGNTGAWRSSFTGGNGTYTNVAYGTSQANAQDWLDGSGSGPGAMVTLGGGATYYDWSGIANGTWYVAVKDSRPVDSVQNTPVTVSCLTTTTTTTQAPTTTTTTEGCFGYNLTPVFDTTCDRSGDDVTAYKNTSGAIIVGNILRNSCGGTTLATGFYSDGTYRYVVNVGEVTNKILCPAPTTTTTSTTTTTTTQAPTTTTTTAAPVYYYYALTTCWGQPTGISVGRSISSSYGTAVFLIGGICFQSDGITEGPSYDVDLDSYSIVSGGCQDAACNPPTTTTTTTTAAPTTTTTTSALYVYNDGGYGNSAGSACSDASNMRTLYSTCDSGGFGNGCNVYVDAGGNNPLTGYTYVFMNGALWDINSSTGVIIVYSSTQC